ncbi:MAG: DNA methyltransferase [Methylocella sp.]
MLDPACGSGNFLYLALQRVKDLEFRVNNESEKLGLKALAPALSPALARKSFSASRSIGSPPRSPAPRSGSATSNGA